MKIRSIISIALLFFICFCSCDFVWKNKAKHRILIIAGDGDFNSQATTQMLRQILEDANFEVRVTEEPAVLETKALRKYSAILLHGNNPKRWPLAQERGLLRFVANGKGLIVIHSANKSFPGWSKFDKMIGISGSKSTSAGESEEISVKVVDKRHPITRGLGNFTIKDAIDIHLRKAAKIHVLANWYAPGDNKPVPVIFVKRYGRGRIFQTMLGHDILAMSNDAYETVLQRGTKWVVGKLK
jgi:type 1 glutamine amidotransferase